MGPIKVDMLKSSGFVAAVAALITLKNGYLSSRRPRWTQNPQIFIDVGASSEQEKPSMTGEHGKQPARTSHITHNESSNFKPIHWNFSDRVAIYKTNDYGQWKEATIVRLSKTFKRTSRRNWNKKVFHSGDHWMVCSLIQSTSNNTNFQNVSSLFGWYSISNELQKSWSSKAKATSLAKMTLCEYLPFSKIIGQPMVPTAFTKQLRFGFSSTL